MTFPQSPNVELVFALKGEQLLEAIIPPTFLVAKTLPDVEVALQPLFDVVKRLLDCPFSTDHIEGNVSSILRASSAVIACVFSASNPFLHFLDTVSLSPLAIFRNGINEFTNILGQPAETLSPRQLTFAEQ